MKKISGEDELDVVISYILIVGVILSVLVEGIGIGSYYLSNGNLEISFTQAYVLKGADFFGYAGRMVLRFMQGSWTPIHILGLGLVLLMITPYVRVIASVLYFSAVRNVKYVFITLFVLVILTASLLTH